MGNPSIEAPSLRATVIKDSMSSTGVRLTTMSLCYPRFIHAEVLTHRVFSRNASSSRATPVSRLIDEVRNHPAVPARFGSNQKGMQDAGESPNAHDAETLWLQAAEDACKTAEAMNALGIHKQAVNRLLEPWQFIRVVVTSTEWDNFFALRTDAGADPTMQALANAMLTAMKASTPIYRLYHLPYVSDYEFDSSRTDDNGAMTAAKISAARCARVSYLTHEGKHPDREQDLKLYDRLVGANPMHMSPTEHQAIDASCQTFPPAFDVRNWRHSNLRTPWLQFRKVIEKYGPNVRFHSA